MESVSITSDQLDRALVLLAGTNQVTRPDDSTPMLPRTASEFLLWLWHLVETEGEQIEFGEGDSCEVWISDRIGMRSDMESKVTTLCTGEEPSKAPESKVAVLNGKLPVEMRIGIRVEDELEFSLMLKGEDLRIHGLAMPRVVYEDGSSNELQATIEERMYLLEQCDKALSKLFLLFTSQRIDPGWEQGRWAQISRWAEE